MFSLVLLMTQAPLVAAPLEAVAPLLSRQVGEWAAEEPDQVYDRRSIFQYIDGAGEVYLAYNMRACLARRYVRPGGPAIVLDIFDMGSSFDAFGIFTHDREGEALELGQGALRRPGWVSFWKGPFFVSLYAEAETPEAERALLELGRSTAAALGAEGPLPPILARLPREGLQDRSVRYFHHPMVLNYHFFLANRNILGLGPEAEGVLAEYLRKEQRSLLLAVEYPNSAGAAEALAELRRHYLPKADPGGGELLENGRWSVARARGRVLAVALESESRSLADELIADLLGGLD